MEEIEPIDLKPGNSQEPTYSELSLGKKLLSLLSLLQMSLPIILSFECLPLASLINVVWLRDYENAEIMIGSLSLAQAWNNLFVNSLIFSVNQGLSVLVSHAFGAGKTRLCGYYLQRGIVILGSVFIAVFFLLWFGADILKWTGVESDLTNFARVYNRVSIPAVVGMGLFECLKSFIIAQKVFAPIVYIQLVTLGLHFFWSFLFLKVLHLGMAGAALCRFCEDWSNCILLFIYIKKSGKFEETFIPWDNEEAFNKEKLKKQIRFTLPMAGVTYFEFIYFDFMLFIAGTLGTRQVVAHLAIAQTSTMNFFMQLGVSITAMSLIGNALGEKNIQKAKDWFTKCLHTGLITCFIVMGCLFIFKRKWYGLWATEPKTLEVILGACYIYIFGMLPLDSVMNAMLAVLKACGMQDFVNKWTLLGLYCIGCPLTLILIFIFDLQVRGLWLGFFVPFFMMSVMFAWAIYNITWKEVVAEIHARLKESSYHIL